MPVRKIVIGGSRINLPLRWLVIAAIVVLLTLGLTNGAGLAQHRIAPGSPASAPTVPTATPIVASAESPSSFNLDQLIHERDYCQCQ